MKIAVCFSGHVRTWQQCWPKIKKCILSPLVHDGHHDVDIHAIFNSADDDYVDSAKICLEEDKKKDKEKDKETENFFFTTAPEYLEIRSNVSEKNIEPSQKQSRGNHLSQLKGIDTVFKKALRHEIETNKQYDIFIRCRPDLMPLSDFDFLAVSSMSDGVLYSLYKRDAPQKCSDMFFCLTRKTLLNDWPRLFEKCEAHLRNPHASNAHWGLEYVIFSFQQGSVLQTFQAGLLRQNGEICQWGIFGQTNT